MNAEHYETDIGMVTPKHVTNEDLRVDIVGLKTEMKGVSATLKEIKTAADALAERRSNDKDKVTSLLASLSVLRWAFGLVVTFIGGACIWTFQNLTEAINTNREQNLRLLTIEQNEKIHDTRIQSLERSQFATTVKEK